jgi:hypothetical protein
MWGILIVLYIAVIIYPFIEEWQQKRADQSALANMRRHSAMGHRWTRPKVSGSTRSRALTPLGQVKRAAPGYPAARRCGPKGHYNQLNRGLNDVADSPRLVTWRGLRVKEVSAFVRRAPSFGSR